MCVYCRHELASIKPMDLKWLTNPSSTSPAVSRPQCVKVFRNRLRLNIECTQIAGRSAGVVQFPCCLERARSACLLCARPQRVSHILGHPHTGAVDEIYVTHDPRGPSHSREHVLLIAILKLLLNSGPGHVPCCTPRGVSQIRAATPIQGNTRLLRIQANLPSRGYYGLSHQDVFLLLQSKIFSPHFPRDFDGRQRSTCDSFTLTIQQTPPPPPPVV